MLFPCGNSLAANDRKYSNLDHIFKIGKIPLITQATFSVVTPQYSKAAHLIVVLGEPKGFWGLHMVLGLMFDPTDLAFAAQPK